MKRFPILLLLLVLILVSACSGQDSTPTLEPEPATATLEPSPELFTLKVMVYPQEGGQVLPEDGEFVANSELILNAIPSKGYVFEFWSGDVSGSGNSYDITMNKDILAIANFSQLATSTPTPNPTATPIPCRRPAEVSKTDAGNVIEICGKVTNWGAKRRYSFLKLDREFLIISYDWVFNNGWIGNCILVTDKVEMLGNVPVIVFQHGEGYPGSDCAYQDDGSRSCSGGDYFRQYFDCE